MSDGARIGPGVPESVYDEIDPSGAAEDEAHRQVEIKAERRRLFLQRVLADPEGRLWLWDLLEATHAFETRFAATGAGPDPMGTWLYAGEQKVGWFIWAQLDEAAPLLAGEMRRLRGAMPG